MPLDLHALSSGGGTALTNIATIALGNDGQTIAGVPIRSNAILRMWGVLTTIADTIREARLLSQDQPDDQNGEYYVLGASSLLGYLNVDDALPYVKGARQFAMRQNTGAANNLAYTLDYYSQGYETVRLPRVVGRKSTIRQVFGGALTAITWGSVGFAPATAIPNGKYAILGAKVHALTNYALIRFSHQSFGGLKPGFFVTDKTNTALANAVADKDEISAAEGYQFAYLGECPVFEVGNQGTGLTIEAIAITADTPDIHLNLVKVA